MGSNKEREAFRQVILKMAKYRLRRVMHLAGYTQQEVREAEIAGEDNMIELIMTKFDEGDINILSLDKDKSPEPREEKSPKRSSKVKDEDDDDPYSKVFDDDDVEGVESDPEPDPSEEQPEEPPEDEDAGVEKHEAETPRRGRRAKREEPRQAEPEASSDTSALEAKMESVLDALVSMGNAIGEVSDKVNAILKFVEGSVQFEEVMKLATARIFKMGAAEPLKGFADLFEKSKPFVDKRLGRTADED